MKTFFKPKTKLNLIQIFLHPSKILYRRYFYLLKDFINFILKEQILKIIVNSLISVYSKFLALPNHRFRNSAK